MTVPTTTILTVSDFNAATDQFAATVDKNLGNQFRLVAALVGAAARLCATTSDAKGKRAKGDEPKILSTREIAVDLMEVRGYGKSSAKNVYDVARAIWRGDVAGIDPEGMTPAQLDKAIRDNLESAIGSRKISDIWAIVRGDNAKGGAKGKAEPKTDDEHIADAIAAIRRVGEFSEAHAGMILEAIAAKSEE